MARPPKVDLSSYQSDMAAWSDQGKSYQEIADLLEQTHRIGVTRQQVRHSLAAHRAEHKAPEPPEPEETLSEPVLGRLPDSEVTEVEEGIWASSPEDLPPAPKLPDPPPAPADCPASLFPDPVENTPPPPQPAPEREEMLQRLRTLLEAGVLTEAECMTAVQRAMGIQTPPAPTPSVEREQADPPENEPAPPQPAPAAAMDPKPVVLQPADLPLPVDEPVLCQHPQWQPPPLPFDPLPTPPYWTPDLPILSFGSGDAWTLQDACEGTFILGATGSGKTSGSGKTLAQAFLDNGFGGLIENPLTEGAGRRIRAHTNSQADRPTAGGAIKRSLPLGVAGGPRLAAAGVPSPADPQLVVPCDRQLVLARDE